MQQSIATETTYCEPCDKTLKTPVGYISHMQTTRVHIEERAAMARDKQLSSDLDIRKFRDGIEELHRKVSEIKVPTHRPGLCETWSCPECRESKMAFARVVLTDYERDLRAAAETYGLDETIDSLIAAHARWVSAGRPVAAKSEPCDYLEIDGLRIVP